MTETQKINRTIKIYPIFYGLTADLIFWIAINTLFLTTVKHLSASQINSIEAIAIGGGIIFQMFLIKIVRKIGNIKAVRLGTILLFLSITINTIATSYIALLIAELCYVIGFVFKNMDNVILIKNLKYLNRSEEYIKLQTKGSTIYSIVTLVISLLSGFLFNINPYLPMVLCIIICFINILITFFIYEVPNKNNEQIINNNKEALSKIAILLILLYGFFYSMIAISQNNSKLFIQLNMQDFLTLDKVAIYMSIIIFVSRIFRLIGNLVFLKVYNKLKNKTIFLLEILLVSSFIILLIGDFVGKNIIGITVMSIGYFIYLAIRDPFANYLNKTLFENTKEEIHDKVINYLNLSRKICSLIYGLVIAKMLVNLSYEYVMFLLLIVSVLFIVLVIKIYQLVYAAEKNVIKQNNV